MSVQSALMATGLVLFLVGVFSVLSALEDHRLSAAIRRVGGGVFIGAAAALVLIAVWSSVTW